MWSFYLSLLSDCYMKLSITKNEYKISESTRVHFSFLVFIIRVGLVSWMARCRAVSWWMNFIPNKWHMLVRRQGWSSRKMQSRNNAVRVGVQACLIGNACERVQSLIRAWFSNVTKQEATRHIMGNFCKDRISHSWKYF